jgi:hypothetical protein
MNPDLRAAFEREMAAARAVADPDRAFRHLERAHILGQRHLVPHLRVHVRMLKLGWLRHDAREVRGQILRAVAAVLGYAAGWVPLGNTGGADVSPLKPMPIPPEFVRYFGPGEPARGIRIRLGLLGAAVVVGAVVLTTAG